MTKVWLVTGANRGLGRAIAMAAQRRGDVVVATARDIAPLQGSFEHVVRLDVRDQATIDGAVAHTLDVHGRIDVVVNNAGHGLVGAVEELADDELRTLLEVNLLGALRVTRAVLPQMRAQGHGHVVQMSSVGGVVANPGHGAYAASKFALEGLSEALAGEVAAWGIRVTIVEPGPFRTDFAGDSMHYAANTIDAYADTSAGQLRKGFADQHGNQPNDPDKAATAILRAVDDPASPLRLPLGPESLDRIGAKLTGQLTDLDRYRRSGATPDSDSRRSPRTRTITANQSDTRMAPSACRRRVVQEARQLSPQWRPHGQDGFGHSLTHCLAQHPCDERTVPCSDCSGTPASVRATTCADTCPPTSRSTRSAPVAA